MIEGKNIYLRALEPEDIDFLYAIENNQELWQYSATQTPYARFVLKEYLDNAFRDIYEVKQLRLVIESPEKEVAGLIDLYDFDPKNKRVGVGIVVTEKYQNKGFAFEAIQLLSNYCFTHLDIHQIYADIDEKNHKSILLFEKAGFVKSGMKNDWNYHNGKFSNVLFYQLIVS